MLQSRHPLLEESGISSGIHSTSRACNKGAHEIAEYACKRNFGYLVRGATTMVRLRGYNLWKETLYHILNGIGI